MSRYRNTYQGIIKNQLRSQASLQAERVQLACDVACHARAHVYEQLMCHRVAITVRFHLCLLYCMLEETVEELDWKE